MMYASYTFNPHDTDTDLAETVLAAHSGDALAAIRSVIADAAHLHGQLEIAAALLSRGAGRGWKPNFRRD